MPRLLRIRTIILCAALVLFIYKLLPSDNAAKSILHYGYNGKGGGGTEALARYMNDAGNIPKIKPIKSSFDWSSVKFAYPHDTSIPIPHPPPKEQRKRIQHVFPPEDKKTTVIREQRRKEVKNVFLKAWNSYKAHAWLQDALLPISASSTQQFSGWAATLVDSLDTLWIMGLRDEFYEAVAAVATIDFGKSSGGSVNFFETTIRYLGGLVAAYDLSGQEVLLGKAREVGDLLLSGFNTRNGMPVDFINFERAKTGEELDIEGSVVLASPGTATLEFARLSQITRDPKYYAAVSKVMDFFAENQNKTRLRGMWPMYISMSRQDVTSGYQFTIGGNADSMYEYLPKAAALLGASSPETGKFETMSKVFMDTAMTHLFFRPMLPGNEDILISGNVDVLQVSDEEEAVYKPRLDPESEHLSCFIGGVYALGGRLFGNETYLDAGAKLAQGCMYAYKSMPTGIMPERYNMAICPDQKNCQWDEEYWAQAKAKRPEWKEHLPKGFTTAKDPRYILRPEAIESVFVLWRITGEERYREAAWDMFKAVANATETEYANAEVNDVTKIGGGQRDYMESFWLAETLKYFYLCFTEPELISLDEFVLNTEAHPFRLAEEGKGRV
ncbi:glycoside hydrolase family 47 protein [Delitschia confertaspora ATCC 74209]|uniref:alpha-1,2-Mannosidase n=1 Tax=Delitschia confertaspora ATCC 74209 TaxID=1513339 RepID=A0A9P4MPG3_9PLEO|nr:glycoside hydrolase family 47 protein [Delitschia confertaspora ATCC 74209]